MSQLSLDRLRTIDDQLQGKCRRLQRPFFDRPVTQVARELLGCLLCHRTATGTQIGRIVEVEAYLGPGDLAAHTARGRTARTRAMFGPPGHAYVYLIYGMYHCMNIVTGPEGSGTAVLLRALAPLADIASATNGPGRLCRALGITMDHYGIDLCGDELWLARDAAPVPQNVVASPRIGVDYAGEWADKPLRFHVQDHPAVSRRPSRKTRSPAKKARTSRTKKADAAGGSGNAASRPDKPQKNGQLP